MGAPSLFTSYCKFYADGGYVSQMGAAFQIIFRWGLRFRRWGRRSQLLCRWGLRNFVHTQIFRNPAGRGVNYLGPGKRYNELAIVRIANAFGFAADAVLPIGRFDLCDEGSL